MKKWLLSEFDYTLPETLIAQFPTKQRTESRLMVVGSQISHQAFPTILTEIRSGDLMIFNDTRVIPARLFGMKKSGGRIECLIERILNDREALAHIRSSHAPKIGAEIHLAEKLVATVTNREGSLFKLKFEGDVPLLALLEQYGHIPLPPYITREDGDTDIERYQTVYAKNKGAIAAPTAGLHFDDDVLAALKHKGVEIDFLTLHVGAGTFQPVRVEAIDQHEMHGEIIDVTQALCDKIAACKARGGRVVAVGTTVVRALESAVHCNGGKLAPYTGETRIFITPGYDFKVIDVLFTNFHLPKSTLLMLVCAFGGYERLMQAYQEAVLQQYRFFSYGDAMLIYPEQGI